MRKGLLVTTVAVLLAFAGAAQAQTVNLEASDPPEDQTITAGDSVDLSFTATLTVEDTACTESVEVPGNATASMQSARDDVQASTDPLSFTLEGDTSHALPSENPTYEDEDSGTVTVETSGGVTEDYQLDVDLFAETDAVEFQDPDGACEDDIPAATSNPLTVSITVEADEEPEEEDDGTGDEDDNTTGDNEDDTDGGADDAQSPEDENGLPLPAILAPFAAGLAAVLRREHA